MTDDKRIATDAAYWIEQVNRPAFDASQGPAFDCWLNADPRHADTFAEMQALWDSPELEAALNDPRMMDDEEDDPEVDAPPMASQPRARWLRIAGAAAVIAALAAIPAALMQTSVQRMATGKGAGADIVLADGSRVELSPNAEIRAEYRLLGRTVKLVRGEAYFDVAHEHWRPFVVESGANVVKVLGTAFNVDRQGETETVVEVFRGTVGVGIGEGDLEPIEAGRTGRLDRGRLTVAALERTQQEPEWKTGWFDASRVPLQVLIDKLNRYSAKTIVVRRPDLLQRNITGRFHVQEFRDTLQALEVAYGVKPKETEDSILLE